MKNLALFSGSLVLGLLLSGCGDATESTKTTQDTTITVERGPLLGATVADANGTIAAEVGAGEYTFDGAIEYPISAVGGIIDINRNGLIDAGEVENTLTLTANEGNVVTLATTLASNSELESYLITDLEIDPQTILDMTPSLDREIEALSDTIYKYAMENNITDPTNMQLRDLEMLENEYLERLTQYQADDLDAGIHEAALISEIGMMTLDNAGAQAARDEREMKSDSENNESDTNSYTDNSENNESDTNAYTDNSESNDTQDQDMGEEQNAHDDMGDDSHSENDMGDNAQEGGMGSIHSDDSDSHDDSNDNNDSSPMEAMF